jgi:hypothetical protein
MKIYSFDYFSSFSTKKLIFVLLLFIVIAYINSLGVYFIWDDYGLIVYNQAIRNPNIKDIFVPLFKVDTPDVRKNPVYFRPLQTLTYEFDYLLWGLNAFGYHLTNILLHSFNALFLFFLLLILIKDRFLCFWASAFFGISPLFTSSVTYLSGRADLLVLFFCFTMAICFFRSFQNNTFNLFYYSISCLCFICALLSKEQAITGILLLILIDKLIFRKNTLRLKNLVYLPYLAIILIWQSLKPPSFPGLHWALANARETFFGALTLFKGLLIYTSLSIVPIHLRMARTITTIDKLNDPWVFMVLVFFIFITTLFAIGWKKNKLLWLGLFWFYFPLTVQIVFNLIFDRIGNELLLPENNLYFSYPGFLIIICLILQFYPKVWDKFTFILLAFLIFYTGRTIVENTYWLDEVRFFKHIIQYNMKSAFNFVVYANLGFAYERADDLKKAEANLKLASEGSGGNPYFYNMLASFYLRHKDFDKALNVLMLSKERDKNFYDTYIKLGIVYLNKGSLSEARENFEKAASIKPYDNTASEYLRLLRKRN